jgi:ABC-type transport system substrate-binding protein/DNA-binding SARP family transcriptional activator
LEFALLGRLEVRADGRSLSLGGSKQRALLALLLLNRNAVVSRDLLIECVWGERAPSSVQASLDSYVSRLRGLLSSDRIERRSPGYVLRVEPGELDLDRFEALVEEARAVETAGDLAAAREKLDAALALWRGRALADLELEQLIAQSERLEEMRLIAFELRADVELQLGGGPVLIGELERLAEANPYRERLIGQLMLSLYRAGRQADALAVYRSCRDRLVDELGIEPGSDLRELERRILQHDPALVGARRQKPDARPGRRPRRRIALGAAALAAVVAAATAALVLTTGGDEAAARRTSTPVVLELNSRSSSLAASSLGGAPAAMVSAAGSIWVAEPDAGEVIRIDQSSGNLERIPVGGTPSALAAGGSAVWVTSVPGAVVKRIDPATNAVTRSIDLGGARASAIAFGFGLLWVADTTDETLLGFDPVTGALKAPISLDLQPEALVVGAGALWVSDYDAGLVARIDAHSGGSIPIPVGRGPVALAVGDRAVWVANNLDSTVSRIDPVSDTATQFNSAGLDPVAIAVDGSSVVVANGHSSTIARLDARSGRVLGTTALGGDPTALVTGGGRLWVGARPIEPHHGGELVLLHRTPLALDPAKADDLPPMQSNGFTYDALLAHPQTSGPRALLTVPDLAVAVPVPTNGGTTFAFRLRRGIRYSDGRSVRAEDFRRAIERLFRLRSSWSPYYAGIVGAAACTVTHCDLRRGIVADNAAGTVVFHLAAPDPNFLANMAYLATAPVPPGTPYHPAGDTIPGTGPYIVESTNQHRTIYVRNPRFRQWSRAAQPDGNPDRIVMRYGGTYAQEIREVERGRADWTSDPIPARLLAAAKVKFAGQVRYRVTIETDFLQLNTTLPPFDDARVRRALNLAIDRAAIVKIFGGRRSATPTCQMLPPGILGYRRYCPYTREVRADGKWRSPDITRALQLVRASGTRGEHVTVWSQTDSPVPDRPVARVVVAALRRLGFRAEVRLVTKRFLDGHPDVFRTMQVRFPGDADTTPFGFLAPFLGCEAPQDHHWFCDPRIDAAIQRANAVQVTDSHAARPLWERLDHELVDRAVLVPLVNPQWVDVVSKRVHNYVSFPNLGLIADQVTLR